MARAMRDDYDIRVVYRAFKYNFKIYVDPDRAYYPEGSPQLRSYSVGWSGTQVMIRYCEVVR